MVQGCQLVCIHRFLEATDLCSTVIYSFAVCVRSFTAQDDHVAFGLFVAAAVSLATTLLWIVMMPLYTQVLRIIEDIPALVLAAIDVAEFGGSYFAIFNLATSACMLLRLVQPLVKPLCAATFVVAEAQTEDSHPDQEAPPPVVPNVAENGPDEVVALPGPEPPQPKTHSEPDPEVRYVETPTCDDQAPVPKVAGEVPDEVPALETEPPQSKTLSRPEPDPEAQNWGDKHIFLSGRFTHEWILDYMSRVQEKLEERGLPVYMVKAGGGEDFAMMTLEGLHRAKVMVAFCTQKYGERTKGTWETFEELMHARREHIPVIPIKLEEPYPPQPGGIGGELNKIMFTERVYIDGQSLDEPKALDAVVEKLVAAVKKHWQDFGSMEKKLIICSDDAESFKSIPTEELDKVGDAQLTFDPDTQTFVSARSQDSPVEVSIPEEEPVEDLESKRGVGRCLVM